jgi:phosphatidate cytidylyltransferase
VSESDNQDETPQEPSKARRRHPDQAPPDPPETTPEGVRIIGPDEATEAVRRGAAQQRRPPEEPRGGDRPASLPDDRPRPALRFPLDASADIHQFERPSGVPVDEQDEKPELSHWSESAPEEVPHMSPRDPYEGDDTSAWSAFAGQGPRWSDDDPEHDDVPPGPGRREPGAPVFDDFAEPSPGRSVFDDPAAQRGGPANTRYPDPYYETAYERRTHDDYAGGERYVDDDYDDSYADSYSDVEADPSEMPPPAAAERSRVTGPRASLASRDRDMRVAVGVGVGLGAAAVILFQFGPPATMVLVVAVLGLASLEYFTATQRAGFDPLMPVGLTATVGAVLAAYHYGEPALPLVIALAVAVCLVWYLVNAGGERPVANVGVTLLGICWVGLLGAYAGLLLAAPNGISLLVAAIVPTIGYDVGALFVGRSAGSRPLSPASPNKTIEGLAGGVVLAVVSGLLLGLLGPVPFDGLADGFKIGLVVAVAAPLGDLTQSLLKRDLGIKDMGTILPGHGGLLDRFDSILFVLPAIWYLSLVVDPQFFF